jgi:choline dehydrogenase-like flavoprotein
MRSETGNINAPIIMIAEKVSDLIRGKNTGESFTRQIRSLDL